MIKCTECGREFKNPQALGGHMRGAHKEETQQETDPNNAAGNPETIDDREEISEAPGSETEPVQEEASQARKEEKAHRVRGEGPWVGPLVGWRGLAEHDGLDPRATGHRANW